jgi:hypothetical protein
MSCDPELGESHAGISTRVNMERFRALSALAEKTVGVLLDRTVSVCRICDRARQFRAERKIMPVSTAIDLIRRAGRPGARVFVLDGRHTTM